MNKFLTYTLLVIGMVGFFSSCQYKFNIEPIVPPPDPMDTIYFSQDVLPIWNNNDYCTSCHKAGATAPDLTSENAYSEVVPAYVNTDQADQSAIYTLKNLEIKEGEKALLCLPAKYIGGKMMIVRSIVGKLLLSYIKPKTQIKTGEEFHFTAMTPHQFSQTLNNNPKEIISLPLFDLVGPVV